MKTSILTLFAALLAANLLNGNMFAQNKRGDNENNRIIIKH